MEEELQKVIEKLEYIINNKKLLTSNNYRYMKYFEDAESIEFLLDEENGIYVDVNFKENKFCTITKKYSYEKSRHIIEGLDNPRINELIEKILKEGYYEINADHDESTDIYIGQDIGGAPMYQAVNVVDRVPGIKLNKISSYKYEQEKYKENLKIPYNQIAKGILIKNGYSEEEVCKMILSSERYEIEEEANVRKSISAVWDSILEKFENGEELKIDPSHDLSNHKMMIEEYIMEDGISDDDYYYDYGYSWERNLSKHFNEKFNEKYKGREDEFVLDILSSLHDSTIKNKENEFLLPIELSGWKKIQPELLYVGPMLKNIFNIKIDEKTLEEAYNKRVQKYILDKEVKNTEDLVLLLSKGKEFYSILEGQEEKINKLGDEEYIRTIVIPQIESNLGNTLEDLRANTVEQVAKNPSMSDLEKLTPEEQKRCEKIIDEENNILNLKLGILRKAHEREKLKEEYLKELEKGKNKDE